LHLLLLIINSLKQFSTMKKFKLVFYFCILSLCGGGIPLSVYGDTTAYTFGVVPQFDAQKIYAIWHPILDELEKLTGYQFRLAGSPTIPAFEVQFTVGEFDFAYMNPYHALKAAQSQQYVPLVRDVGRTLYGIVVVRKDSPITDVAQLDGKTVAFPAPNALGASLIPRADFKSRFGIKVVPRYVQSHSSVYLNVALGRVVAGGGVQKSLSQQDAPVRDKLKVIYQTREFSPHPVVAHGRIPAAVREKVKQAFLTIAETEQGRLLLSKIPITKIGPAALADYQPLSDWGLDKYYVQE
jgi:phosphonate transport system substrate-binding protein